MTFLRERGYAPFKRGYAKPWVRHVARLLRDSAWAKHRPSVRIAARYTKDRWRDSP